MKKTSKAKKSGFEKIFKEAFILTIYVAITLFLFFNIFLSQSIHPTYFQLVNNDQKAAVYYLQSIQKFPQYNIELSNFKNIYGNGLEDSLAAEKNAKKSVIQNFERILNKNQYARDILYSLFLITGRQDYIQQAKAVDPSL